MELFYSQDIDGTLLRLDPEETRHCVKVLRHRTGEEIFVIDGQGRLLKCILTSTAGSRAQAEIVERTPSWGGHPYHLTMAVCPTKNNERFEWFLEKACEIGVDRIVPLIGERSERKVYKTDRARKILVSASKQSLKAAVPVIDEPIGVKDFLKEERPGIKCIAYCFEDQTDLRQSINEVLASIPVAAAQGPQPPAPAVHPDASAADNSGPNLPEIIVMIGPEGDFSPEEARAARAAGFLPVHFGPSRMRTETAALFAVFAVYQHFV
ncbi:MAG: 16S rRNA (uracil(1498)-N(3))-methyltransferase [Bacteroidales bacterium]|nr:16S rRNA (uracil(1498)-N(3))-methyltransferase [Bacteroidales bacterium]